MTFAVLIDPHRKTVTKVTLPANYRYATLLDCEAFDCVMLRAALPNDPGAALYVDDTGLYREGQAFWSFKNAVDRIYAGKGLITAVNTEGDECDGVSAPEEIAPHIVWRAVRFIGITTREDDVVDPILGPVRKITHTPQFEAE
jgi:hypothetical protein